MLDGIGASSRYPTIKNFKTWEEVKQYLKEENNAGHTKSNLDCINNPAN
jgi:hypothetical protein